MEKDNNFWLWPYCLSIFVLGFVVYFQAIFFGYVYLDDHVIVLENLPFLSDFSNILRTFKQDFFHSAFGGAYYRPILTISFMPDAHMGGAKPFIYHLTNVLIHLTASCLVFLTLVKMGYKKQLCFFFGLVFVVHPILTQAVAMIVGRNDSLVTVFALASFIVFLNYLKSKKVIYLLLHLLFFTLAVLTKENAFALIILCVYYMYFIADEKKYVLYKYLVSFWAGIVVVWCFLRNSAITNSMKFSVPEIAKAVMQKLPSILQFLGKILFPVNMSVFTTVKDTTIIYGIVVLVFIYVALWFTKNRRYSYAIFGASWFLLFLMPSFITEFSVVSTYLEERIYLSLIGFIIVLLETDVVNKAFQNRRSAAIFGAMIILLFTAITFNYSKDYRNRIAYWESAVKNAQSSPLAHRNLGAMYYLDGIKDKAEMEFVKSLELNKNEPMAHNNIGILLMEKGDLKGAETEYKKEIEINPMFPNVYYNLGLLYYKENRLNEASAVWEKAIETNPNYIDAYYNLAVVYYVQGKYNECAIYVRYLKDKGVKLDSKLLSVIKE